VPEKPTDVWRWFSKEELAAEAPTIGIKPSIVFYATQALETIAARATLTAVPQTLIA
jgi:hypothetical protein